MADFDQYDNGGSGNGFVMGLIAGTVLGAGLGMLLAPKAGSELRGAIGEQARNFGRGHLFHEDGGGFLDGGEFVFDGDAHVAIE